MLAENPERYAEDQKKEEEQQQKESQPVPTKIVIVEGQLKT